MLPLHSRPPAIIQVRAVFNYLAVFEGQNRTEGRLPFIALVGIEQRSFNHHDVTGGVGMVETNLAPRSYLENATLEL